jgi:hypothetical protein
MAAAIWAAKLDQLSASRHHGIEISCVFLGKIAHRRPNVVAKPRQGAGVDVQENCKVRRRFKLHYGVEMHPGWNELAVGSIAPPGGRSKTNLLPNTLLDNYLHLFFLKHTRVGRVERGPPRTAINLEESVGLAALGTTLRLFPSSAPPYAFPKLGTTLRLSQARHHPTPFPN